jgi:hypothetical protein
VTRGLGEVVNDLDDAWAELGVCKGIVDDVWRVGSGIVKMVDV